MWISLMAFLIAFLPQGEEVSIREELKITVLVTDLRNDKGNVLLSLFDKEKGFPGESEYALQLYSTGIKEGKAKFQFSVPQGEYAISVMHDENGNNELDATFLGMPKEGIGVSMNPKSFMGPPKYKNAKFEVNEDIELRIKMLYL